MRSAAAFALAMSASLLVLGSASAQNMPGAVPSLVAPPALAPAPSLDPVAAPLAPAPAAPPSLLAPAAPPHCLPQHHARAPAPTTGQSSRPLVPAAIQAQPPALAPQRAPAPVAQQELRQSERAWRSPAPWRSTPPAVRASASNTSSSMTSCATRKLVLTFDDGPWVSTPAVLKALADECVKATFFAIGKHATYYPEILRAVGVKAGPHGGLAHMVPPRTCREDSGRSQGGDREGHQAR